MHLRFRNFSRHSSLYQAVKSPEKPMPSPHHLQRRTLTAALVIVPSLWLGARAQPAPRLRATPSQSEGPFYPVSLPKD